MRLQPAPFLAAHAALPAVIRQWLVRMLTAICLAGLNACSSLPPNTGRIESHALPDAVTTPLGQMVQSLRQHSGSRQRSAFVLIDSADEAYASRLALTQQATRTLDLQYYAIHADPSTRSLLHVIRAAAARGVRVRILLDDFNTKGGDAQVLRLAFMPNVEMRLFNPLPGWRSLGALRNLSTLTDFRRLQHRMHNKLYIADNVLGITGGRNLGDAYFGQSNDSNFIDMDVLAMGQVVQQMSRSFDSYWNHPLAYPVQTLISRKTLDQLRQIERHNTSPDAASPHIVQDTPAATPPMPEADLPDAMSLPNAPWRWAPSALLVDAPAKLVPEENQTLLPDTVVRSMLDLMQKAQKRVLIVSPYFVPSPTMLQTFADLRQRGVHITALTNSLAATDAPAAHIGYARHRETLLRLGIDLYEMRALQPQSARSAFGSSGKANRASLHAKLVVVDDHVLNIGSMNLDQRSALQNSEVALLIRSRPLVQAIDERVTPILQQGAWHMELSAQGKLVWRAPPQSTWQDQHSEPDASAPLQLLLHIAAPLASDELL